MFKKFMRKHGWKVINGAFVTVAFVLGVVVGVFARATPAPAQNNTQDSKTTATAPVIVYVPNDDTEQPQAEEPQEEQPAEEQPADEQPKTVEVIATAYCPCEKCCGKWALSRPTDANGNAIVYTASGAIAQAGRTIAVDTSVFPFGTVLTINGVEYVAEDRGGAIKGNRIDVYFDDHNEALQFGRQTLTAYV